MKKVYKKPSIYIETFKLDTAIASCGAGANSGSAMGSPLQGNPYDCHFGFDEGGLETGIFAAGVESKCSNDKTDLIFEVPVDPENTDEIFEYYCYHQPTDDLKVFAS